MRQVIRRAAVNVLYVVDYLGSVSLVALAFFDDRSCVTELEMMRRSLRLTQERGLTGFDRKSR